MKQKYCLPIIKSKTEEVLKIISGNQNSYDFFEIWLDYIKDLNLAFIEKLRKELNGKLIFLFRRQNLETPKMDFKKRIEDNREIISYKEKASELALYDVEGVLTRPCYCD